MAYFFPCRSASAPTNEMAALSIILFLYSWNNYLWPLLISSDRTMFTAPVALGSLIGPSKVSWGGIMAGAVLLTAPMIAVFLSFATSFLWPASLQARS